MSVKMFIQLFCVVSIIVGSAILCAVLAMCAKQIWLQVSGKRYYIRKAAKKLGISKALVLSQFEEVLSEAKSQCLAKAQVEMRFSPWYPVSKRWEIGMATTFNKLRRISYAPAWVYYIVTSPRLWTIAFMQSVGHELAHREDPNKGGIRFYFRPKAERRFFYWLREVRNDFAGVHFVLDCYGHSKKTVMNAMKKKAEKYEQFSSKGEYITHPSWQTRLALLKSHDCFNEAVIDAVAKAAGCTNEAYIAELKQQLKSMKKI